MKATFDRVNGTSSYKVMFNSKQIGSLVISNFGYVAVMFEGYEGLKASGLTLAAAKNDVVNKVTIANLHLARIADLVEAKKYTPAQARKELQFYTGMTFKGSKPAEIVKYLRSFAV